MENEEKNSKILGILSKKKAPKKETKSTLKEKTSDSEKDVEAARRVDELLKGTNYSPIKVDEPVKEEFAPENLQKEKDTNWVQSQLDECDAKIHNLEEELEFYKNKCILLERENGNLRNGTPAANTAIAAHPVASIGYNENVAALFRHFESVYMKGFTQARIAHPESGGGVLDMFQQYFPELQNVRRYRYRGMDQ